MSETAFQGLDPYISMPGDVTPSNVHRLQSASLLKAQANVVRRFRDFTLQKEAGPHQLSSWRQRFRWTDVPMGTTSETANDVWEKIRQKLAQLVEMRPSRQRSFGPDDDWKTVNVLKTYRIALSQFRSAGYLLPENERSAVADWSLAVHQNLRPPNVLVSLRSPDEPQPTPDEKRYRELNQKYYDETITKEEQFELVKMQEALDEADAKDPEVVRLNKGVSEGYDKLHNALRQINRILDEVLPK